MSDIFQEIEEDIRREKLDKVWEQYGSWIMIGAGTIVVGVAAWLWWGEAQERRNAALSDEYLAASELLAAGDEAGMAALEEIITNRASGYVVLASMQKAAKFAAEGKTDEAIRAYDAIRSSNKTDDVLGQLAAIKAGWLLVESEDNAAMKARLGDIAFAEDEGPWAAAATEILAYSAVRANDFEEAEMLYLKIPSMRSATMGIVGRNAEMLSVIQPQIVRPALVPEPVLAPPAEDITRPALAPASADDEVEAGGTSDNDTSTPPEGE